LEKRLTTDSQAILDRLDSVEESYLADRLAINQRIDTLLETVTTLARQQELLNSYPCSQSELDEHLAKIDSYLSSYKALQARVDELSTNFAQLERMSVTLSQQNGENLAQFKKSLQEQIFQLLIELETVKNAIAPSPISSAIAQEAIVPRGQREAIASQESLPLSPDQSEPTLIGEHSLLSVTSSPTEPSPNVSESTGDWLTLGEAHKIAKANGYKDSLNAFRLIAIEREEYNQVYAQYGLKADPERHKKGQRSKYFCRHSLS
jgi:hypothetical protein